MPGTLIPDDVVAADHGAWHALLAVNGRPIR